MASNTTMSSVERAAARDQKSADRQAAFDKLPMGVQLLIGIVGLAVVAAAGFAVFFAIDILLLDFDPVGKIVSTIAHAVK